MGLSLATITTRHCHSSLFHASLQHNQKVFQTPSTRESKTALQNLPSLSLASLGAPICFMQMESSEGKESVKHKADDIKEEGGGKEKAKEEEEDENCRTPTGSGNRIPEIQNCPPAPRKRRRSPSSSSSSSSLMRRSSFIAHQLQFFEDTNLHEVDSFFQSISMNELFKLKRRCRSV